MHHPFVLRVLAAVAVAIGLTSAFGAIALDELSPLLRATSIAASVLLVFAAWLLLLKRPLAVLLLWFSAVVYAASMFYPALVRHSWGVFSALIPAFYWSLAIRVALAVSAHFAVKRALARGRHT